MFAYKLSNSGLTKYYNDALNITEVTGLSDETLVIKDGKIFLVDKSKSLSEQAEIESGFIPLFHKSRTTDIVIDRYPRCDCELTITNEEDESVDYEINENVFKDDLARGHKLRYLKYNLKFSKSAILRYIRFYIEEETTT